VSARIVQISVSAGGVPKTPVAEAHVTPSGVAGDGHRHPAFHGGPDRAVCLYAMEAVRGLQAEGHGVAPGSLGENVTIEGLDWDLVVPGARLHLGDAVVLEVTRYTSPCVNISRAFRDGDYARVSHTRHPGWSRVYTRVLAAGTIRAGDAVLVLDGRQAAALDPTATP
jgi:MOSC domain-containing protein YiiM